MPKAPFILKTIRMPFTVSRLHTLEATRGRIIEHLLFKSRKFLGANEASTPAAIRRALIQAVYLTY